MSIAQAQKSKSCRKHFLRFLIVLGLCFFQNVCQILWCSVNDSCRSKLDSPIDGTRCGPEKVNCDSLGFVSLCKQTGTSSIKKVVLSQRHQHCLIPAEVVFNLYHYSVF